MWRVYYSNGNTFDSNQGEPEDAPATGVLLIAQTLQDTRLGMTFAHMGDYYIWKDSQWFACDYAGFFQYMFVEKHKQRAVLLGEYVSNERYMEARERAKAWANQLTIS